MCIYTIIKTLLIYIAISNSFEIKFIAISKDLTSVKISTPFAKLQDWYRCVPDRLSLSIRCFWLASTLIAWRILCKVKISNQAWTTLNKEIHLLCVFGMLLISFVLYFSGFLGMTIYGYCGLEFTPSIAYI